MVQVVAALEQRDHVQHRRSPAARRAAGQFVERAAMSAADSGKLTT
jgi:hypothetical protein